MSNLRKHRLAKILEAATTSQHDTVEQKMATDRIIEKFLEFDPPPTAEETITLAEKFNYHVAQEQLLLSWIKKFGITNDDQVWHLMKIAYWLKNAKSAVEQAAIAADLRSGAFFTICQQAEACKDDRNEVDNIISKFLSLESPSSKEAVMLFYAFECKRGKFCLAIDWSEKFGFKAEDEVTVLFNAVYDYSDSKAAKEAIMKAAAKAGLLIGKIYLLEAKIRAANSLVVDGVGWKKSEDEIIAEMLSDPPLNCSQAIKLAETFNYTIGRNRILHAHVDKYGVADAKEAIAILSSKKRHKTCYGDEVESVVIRAAQQAGIELRELEQMSALCPCPNCQIGRSDLSKDAKSSLIEEEKRFHAYCVEQKVSTKEEYNEAAKDFGCSETLMPFVESYVISKPTASIRLGANSNSVIHINIGNTFSQGYEIYDANELDEVLSDDRMHTVMRRFAFIKNHQPLTLKQAMNDPHLSTKMRKVMNEHIIALQTFSV